ncbi:putative T6SS immunity periplasmic lipoprotein [Cronobacter turicensis]
MSNLLATTDKAGVSRPLYVVQVRKNHLRKKALMTRRGQCISALFFMLTGCVTLPPRHTASVTAVSGNICIRVPAQQGERLDWMEIMESDKPSSTIIHYDVANPVWVAAEACLPVKGFHFVAGKSYTVLIATVTNAKDAHQYESTFTTGQGLTVIKE